MDCITGWEHFVLGRKYPSLMIGQHKYSLRSECGEKSTGPGILGMSNKIVAMLKVYDRFFSTLGRLS